MHWKLSRRTALIAALVLAIASVSAVTVAAAHRGGHKLAKHQHQFGAEPVAYGPGLADRVRTLAPEGVTAATDLFGIETAEAALALGVPPERISTVAAGPKVHHSREDPAVEREKTVDADLHTACRGRCHVHFYIRRLTRR